MNLKTIFLFFIILGLSNSSYCQVGTWKYYFNSTQYTDIETVDNDLYINGKRAIFQVNTATLEVNKIDQTTGLSNFSISKLKYNKETKTMLVVYENQAIDIIDFSSGRKKITPNYDITNKILITDKSINQIKFIGNDAFLCSKIGIIVFNYTKNEIKATYIIGNKGNYKNVNSIELLNNNFYALTDSGIMTGLDNVAVNLQDFNNWTVNTSFPKLKFLQSENINNTLYLMSNQSLWIYKNSNLINIKAIDTAIKYKNLHVINGKVYLVYDKLDPTKNRISSEIVEWSETNLNPVYSSSSHDIMDIGISKESETYFSCRYILKKESSDTKIVEIKKEPLDEAFRLQKNGDELFTHIGVVSANLDVNKKEDGMYVLSDNKGFSEWSQNAYWEAGSHKLYAQTSVINAHGGTYRAYNWGGVLFQSNGDNKIFNLSNSTLDTNKISGGVIRVSDLQYNPIDQSIWILNFSSSEPLKSLSKDGKWRSHNLSQINSTTELSKLVIDQAGTKWISTRDQGIIMFNEQNIEDPSDDIIRGITSFTTYNSKKVKQCELNTKYTLDMELDRDGNLWVGTDKGIGIITTCTYDPNADCTYAIPIQTTQAANDTNKYQECVFLNTAVSAIAFDGGNNLWVGTNDGAFYSSEFAGYEALNLNKFNSPLTSKSIFDIAVHPKSGEVIFTTDIGVLGYMGQSTDATYMSETSPYFVTPNPVPKEYQGLISIDGLPENAYYKITDVLGNLIYQGKANGSRVTWDGKSLNGKRVVTGVYYIFSGKSLLVGKTGVGSFTVID